MCHCPRSTVDVVEGQVAVAGAQDAKVGMPMTSDTSGSRHGVREKRPEHRFDNGAMYTGEWVGDKRDGNGTQVWTDGARYEGQWVEDKAQGTGMAQKLFVHTYQEEDDTMAIGPIVA